jgi:hypothetical protein
VKTNVCEVILAKTMCEKYWQTIVYVYVKMANVAIEENGQWQQ